MSSAASHLARLLSERQELLKAAAKAADCSPALLRTALSRPEVLSALQWRALEDSLQEAPGWLGSGAPWTETQVQALLENTRSRRSPVELQRARRHNLRRLADSVKPAVTLARALNTSASMLSDLMNAEVRPFGSRRARAMEELLGLSEGWLDRDDPVPAELVVRLQQHRLDSQARAANKWLPADSAGSVRASSAAPGLLALGALRPLHQAVLAKYHDLAAQNAIDEVFALELMRSLLERDGQAASAKSAEQLRTRPVSSDG